jgi:hypothetical protein
MDVPLQMGLCIKLECKPSPDFRKVYPMMLTKQTEMDMFLEEALATACI